MKIWGYTEEKETVEVDLSVDEIVAAGIDPWRLDLFDPEPVALTIAGTVLRFRRLRDVCMAYLVGEDRCIIGRHDGTSGTCVSAEISHWTTDSVSLKNLTPCGSFDEFLRVYLPALDEYWLPGSKSCNLEFFIFQGARGVATLFLPTPSSAFSMRGTELVLTNDQKALPRFSYVGEMLADTRIRTHLPKEVEWIFAELKRFEPVIEIPAEVLRGAPLKKVRLRTRKLDVNEAMWIREKLGSWWERSSIADRVEHNDPDFRLHNWDHQEITADWVRCCPPDEVWCTRIGYFDLAKKQTRPLSLWHYQPKREVALLKQGFNVLEGPFTAEQSLMWHERLLRTRIPGSSWVYNAIEFGEKVLDVIKDIGEFLVELAEDAVQSIRARLRGARAEE